MMNKKQPDLSVPVSPILPKMEFFHALISNGSDVLVADQRGNFNIGGLDSGVHSGATTDMDRMLLNVWQNNFVTAGQWNSVIAVWEPTNARRLLTTKLFNGRITALAAVDSALFVAGADHDPNASSLNNSKDAAILLPGRIAKINLQGQVTWLDTNNKGAINYLAAGSNWVAYSDESTPGSLFISVNNTEKVIQIGQKLFTAFYANTTSIWIADDDAVWQVDALSGKFKKQFTLSNDFFRVLKIVQINEVLFLMTSEGVFQAPGFKRISRHRKQAVDITAQGENLLILWDMGIIDSFSQKDGATKEFKTFVNQ